MREIILWGEIRCRLFSLLWYQEQEVKPAVKAIKEERNIYAALAVVSTLLTVLFIAIGKPEAAIACGVGSAAALVFLYRQSRLLYAAKLICDNRILTVPSSISTQEGHDSEKMMEETVVSTFGLLLGKRVYQWGCDGRHGVRLQTIQFDRARIRLTFGEPNKTLSVELPHGLTDAQAVSSVKHQLWHETGVEAAICGWNNLQEN